MATQTVHQPRQSSEKSFSNQTLDENELLEEFCQKYLPVDRKDRSSLSTVFNSTTKQKSTPIRVHDGTKDLLLKWSTREELIAILNEYTVILHGKVPDDEQTILDRTNTLLQTLGGLPMRLKERVSDGFKILNELAANCGAADSNAAACSKPSNQNPKSDGDLLLDLKWKTRSKIIETLTTNQSFAIFNRLYISDESKRGLVQKNNELIQTLLGLHARLVEREKIGHLFDGQVPKDDK